MEYLIRSHLANDLSHLFVHACATWALYSVKSAKNVFLNGAYVVIITYGAVGYTQSYLQNLIPNFTKFQEMTQTVASVIPIALINVTMMQELEFTDSAIWVHLALSVLPIFVKWTFYKDDEVLLHITIMSNICSLGYMLLNLDSDCGIVAACWHVFNEFIIGNPMNLSRLNRNTAFNVGLGVFCLLSEMCIFNQTN